MDIVRWFEAEAGVRRSKRRSVLSEETADRMLGACGENCAEYVQEWIGSVTSEELA